MAPRTPLPPELLSTDTKQLCDLLNEGADASVVIVGVSYIDACLASLIAKRLRKSSVTEKLLDSRSGPIGSFVARADLAYALALISKSMYQDLLVLAELRNVAAHHHFELSFASETIVAGCSKLKYISGLKNGGTDEPLMDEGLIAPPRNRFTITALMIVNRLLITALETNHAE